MVSATDAISGIYTVAKAIYEQVQTVKANQKQCLRLGERVGIVEQAVQDLEKRGNVNQYEKGLNALQNCLTNALAFVQKFQASHKLARYLLKTGSNKEQFAELNDELQKAVGQLSLGLVAQQLMNSDQDKADREADTQTLLANQKEILKQNEAMLANLQALTLDEQDRHQVMLLQFSSLKQQLDTVLRSPSLRVQSPTGFDSRLQIPYYELAFDRKLGEGHFGKIYLGRYREQPVAIKLLEGQLTSQDKQQFLREVQIMSRCRHPHITQLLGAALENQQACLVMEHMEKGSLYDVLGQTTLSPDQQKQVALDIARGLLYLHSEGIWHRDLKSANILLDAHYKAKITDFGLSKIQTTSIQTITEQSQAPKWQAPECFERQAKYTEASDIYSYGMIVWEIVTGQRPFAHIPDHEFIGRLLKGERETLPSHVPSVYAELIQACWAKDPAQRPGLTTLISRLEAYQPRPPSPTPEATYDQGIQHEQHKDYAAAYTCYQKAQSKGHVKACTNLGLFHLMGRGGASQDKAQAYQLFMKGAQGGHVRAMVNVATMLEYGDGITKDLTQALHWYEQAAQAGDSKAAEKAARLRPALQAPSYRGFDASFSNLSLKP